MLVRRIVAGTIALSALAVSAGAQVPGQNVNMVAGMTWPGGDPFLQRQNEPSMAVSSRNPLHMLAGANDYRTVDLPGLPSGGVTGDAWLGLFKSTNGGGRWTSTLIPGYPQDTSPEGLASPLKGMQAGADPVVRAGSNGLFYYGGLAFIRGDGQPSRVFVARYLDRNNRENGDPIAYLGTSIVARNAPGQFVDKPTIAVDIPRPGAGTCSINGTTVRAGSVYAAWTVFLGQEDEEEEGELPNSRIVFARSTNCGVSWSNPVTLSDLRTNQAASIAIDPRNGHIYVAWRQFETFHWIHAILVVKSTDGGRTFSHPLPIWGFFPFDQGTTGTSFRTNSYPTIAVDHTGRVYAAWAARAYAPGNHHPFKGDARIVMATSKDGKFWTFPRAVDNFPGRGHQIMPALSFAGGKLQLVYYDFREDVSGFFEQFVDELSILLLPPGTPGKRRHTVDVRTAQADPGTSPQFASYSVTPIDPSTQASRYPIGSRPGSTLIEQLQFNPPNLPLFGLGTVPFIGDYIDVAAQTIMPVRGSGQDQWKFSGPGDDPVFHLVWADNRDVRPPADGNWSNYTPPTSGGSGGPSIFDPTQSSAVCIPGQAGMRNQNIYTTRVTPGLVAGAAGNAKPLSTTLPRAFVVFAQNTTPDLALYRFSIRNQPVGGSASFQQFALLTTVDVLVLPGSSAARTVFVTSTNPDASVLVDIVQIAGPGVPPPPPGGRSSTVVLNPDITNPDITNPDITNPDITNPDITNAEVHNPDITNPDITNPDITNPDITNPDITNPDITNTDVANPDITNPDITNPDITNPDITNPDITNPDITNPDITNGSISDYSYPTTNEGNTSSQYEVDLEATDPVPGSIKLQLVIHRIYKTPVVDGCTLKTQTQNQVLLNLPNPLEFTGPITFWLEPGEEIKLTIRVVDTNRNDDITWSPVESLVVTVTAGAVNSDDAAQGIRTPPSATSRPPVAVADVYDAVAGQTLNVEEPGVIANDQVPEGLEVEAVMVAPPTNGQAVLNPDGSFTYSPAAGFAGTDTFTYRLVGGLRSNVAPVTLRVASANPLVVTTEGNTGAGSLRAAIDFANSHPNGEEPDRISFNIPGAGPHRINLDALLPTISDRLVLDGSSQAGYEGVPLVILDGSDLPRGEGIYGLAFTSGSNVVRALGVVNVPGKGIVFSEGNGNLLQGSWIGIDPVTGASAPTVEAGVAIMDGSSFNVIGVVCAPGEEFCSQQRERNVVSGNNGAGIAIYDGNSNAIRGNIVGTNPAGTAALPNAEGISVSAGAQNMIGGAASGYGNIISGNRGPGVLMLADPLDTAIVGNLIGVGVNQQPIGNGGGGVLIQGASRVVVGGTSAADGNIIANNAGSGVVVLSGETNSFLGNSIFTNAPLGIDLGGDGVTPNDPRDVDLGPNRLQNSPELTSAIASPNGASVSGHLIAEAPGALVRFEFFRDAACVTGNELAQARQLVRVFTATTNADGFAAFEALPIAGLAPGEGVTATATVTLPGVAGSNTSEVSNCVTVRGQ